MRFPPLASNPVAVAVVALVAAAPPCLADSVSIAPSADTCLFERDPDNNWGAESEVVAGSLGPVGDGTRARALFRFDVAAAVPSGAVIESATLTLECTRSPAGAVNSIFQLLRVEASWNEGDNDSPDLPGGTPADPGETTWAARSHPDTPWSQPGGKFEVDFAEDPSASQFVAGAGTYSFQLNANGIADLQSMLDAPAANHGWVLITSNESLRKSARRWAAREHPTAPPQLAITFTPPPPPAPVEILNAALDPQTGELIVTFAATAGTTYALQWREALTSGSWLEAARATAPADGATALSAPPPPAARRLFFRIHPHPPDP